MSSSLKRALFVVAVMALLSTAAAARQFQVLAQQMKGHFYPGNLLPVERQALLSKAAMDRRFDRVSAADVVEFLGKQDRGQEAVQLAIDTMRAQPAKIAEILTGVGKAEEWSRNAAKLRDTITAEIPDLRSRIRALPREQAAQAAYALLNSERDRTPVNDLARLREFVRDYEGTAAASLADLDITSLEEMNATHSITTESDDARLEKFARDHPGTVGGASALYYLGEAKGSGRCCGVNLADRFREILDIITELESGRFPPCEWVDNAHELGLGFLLGGVDLAKLPPQDSDVIIGVYKKFILAHLGDHAKVAPDEVSVLFNSELPKLFKARNISDGMNRTVDELVRVGNSPDAVRYLQTMSEYFPFRWSESVSDRAEEGARSVRMLEDLSVKAASPWRERALESLASQLYGKGDFKAAAAAYERYVKEFPESDHAWVAAIGRGQAQAESHDYRAARQSLRKAAESYPARPIARTVALAFAAQASAALGDFSAELADLRLAIDAWDPAFGSSFQLKGALLIDPLGVPTPTQAGTSDSDSELRRDALAARVATLEASLPPANGNEFETARWRVQHEDWDGALSILQRLAKDTRSPFHVEATTLARKARLERALRWVDVHAKKRDENGAAREFENLAATGQDFTAAAARIARAALAWKQAKRDDAKHWMREGMEAWLKLQQSAPAPARGSLEEDVLGVRGVPFPGHVDTPYQLAPPETIVWLPNERTKEVFVSRAPEGMPNVLFVSQEQEAFLTEVLDRFGDTAEQFSEPPSIAPSPSAHVRNLFSGFFYVQPGRWFGWIFYARPPWIEFKDEQRSSAHVAGGEGFTILVEKLNGLWTYVRVTSISVH